jgi:hypothetical protein
MDAYTKAMTIYELLGSLYRNIYSRYYDTNGALNFGYRSDAALDCRITPNGNGTYNLRFYKVFNMRQYSVLKEISHIKAADLLHTFVKTINHLDSEYIEYNKGKTGKSWWGYTKMENYY